MTRKSKAQGKPPKEHILALLESGPMTCAELSKLMGIDSHTVRNHITTLRRNSEVFRLDGTSPVQFSLEPQAEPGIPDAAPVEDEQPLRILRPVGTWERQTHRPSGAVASVFELGVA